MGTHYLIDQLHLILPSAAGLAGKLDAMATRELFRPRQVWHTGSTKAVGACYIEEGLFQSYYIGDDGQQVTTGFLLPGEFLIVYGSNGSGNGNEYLEALQPSVIRSIVLDRMVEFFSSHAEWNLLALYVLRQHRAREISRLRLLHLTAAGRYAAFRRLYPKLFSLVPLRLIASYLNMTRENLSRLISRDH